MTRSIWPWLRLAGGMGILAVLSWRLGTGPFLDGVRLIDAPALLLALGIGACTTVVSAWRWCLVARGVGLRLSLSAAVADYYKALFLNAALPGGVLGDVDRAVRHGRDSGDVGRGVRAVVLERTAGQLVLFGAGLAVLLTVPSPMLTLLGRHATVAGAGIASLVAAGAVALLAVRRLRRNGSRLAGAVRAGIADLRAGILARRAWPGVTLASMVVLLGHLGTFVVAARVAGSSVSLARLAPLLLLALLAMSVPINIGGWGPREAVTAWAFGAAGLSATQGLTIAVVYGLLAFVAALPGALVLIMRALTRFQSVRLVRAAAPVSPAAVAIEAFATPFPAARELARSRA